MISDYLGRSGSARCSAAVVLFFFALSLTYGVLVLMRPENFLLLGQDYQSHQFFLKSYLAEAFQAGLARTRAHHTAGFPEQDPQLASVRQKQFRLQMCNNSHTNKRMGAGSCNQIVNGRMNLRRLGGWGGRRLPDDP